LTSLDRLLEMVIYESIEWKPHKNWHKVGYYNIVPDLGGRIGNCWTGRQSHNKFGIVTGLFSYLPKSTPFLPSAD